MIVFFLLLFLGASFGVASVVYRKQQNAGRNPLGWAILAFILTALVVFFGGVALFNYAFGFGR